MTRRAAARTFVYLSLVLAAVVVLLPLGVIVLTSLKSEQEMADESGAVSLPGDLLNFHFVDDEVAGLISGPYDIAQPSPDAPLCPTDGIQIFLCPGLGFTRCGKRLGRGKGFYDRSLAPSDSESIRVGVCFREQLHPELPVDPHDMPMHFLATADGVVECR